MFPVTPRNGQARSRVEGVRGTGPFGLRKGKASHDQHRIDPERHQGLPPRQGRRAGAARRQPGGGRGRVSVDRRALRQRQDDAAEPDRLRRHAHLGHGGGRGPRHRQARRARADRAAPRHDRLHLPELQPGERARRVSQRRAAAALAAHAERAASAASACLALARPRRLEASTSSIARASSPAASASASPSPARWSRGPSSCWPTSPPRTSIRSPARTSST